MQPTKWVIQGGQGLGHRKISDCCWQAVSDGFEYVWIHTVCMDKTNSVELSEAITSIFRWYQNATEC
jgi:hypothetical protein